MKKVSIVIPVYNVGLYIDQCLESICEQTYRNIEIIVIYDESSDDSLVKCQKWAKKDERIILIINQNRGGLGVARNIGLSIATGEYLVYVDSDDWLDKKYIEILYSSIERTQANYVSSIGFYGVQAEEKINKTMRLPVGEYNDDDGRILVLLRDFPAVWKKIYSRKWLIEEAIFQPEIFYYEDWGYNIALVLCSEKIVLISEIGVFYRVGREGSLSKDSVEAVCLDFRKSIEFGLGQIQRNKESEKYWIAIQQYLLRDIYLRQEKALLAQDEKASQILQKIKADILIKTLGYKDIDSYKRHICFGSFSLRWIMQRTIVFAKNMEYYGFSSIISAFTCGKRLGIKNQNDFRLKQISNDIIGAFGQEIDLLNEKSILFLDFLEEYNHVWELEDGQYFTNSEAYVEATIEKAYVKNLIQSGTHNFIYLWKSKCLELVEKLNNKKNIIEVVLVKNRMSLCYGNLNRTYKFDKERELNQINDMLFNMEEYFLNQCKLKNVFVNVFELPEKYCFTDEQFRYGCEPQYMNEALYTWLGYEIFKRYVEKQVV